MQPSQETVSVIKYEWVVGFRGQTARMRREAKRHEILKRHEFRVSFLFSFAGEAKTRRNFKQGVEEVISS